MARAVQGTAFLVAGDQKGEGAARLAAGKQALDSDHHGRESRLHVGGAATVQHAIADFRHERIAQPVGARSRRYDIGVAGQTGQRRATAERSEEHTSEIQSLMRISYAVLCLKKKIIYPN